jgi:hypothetical protein
LSEPAFDAIAAGGRENARDLADLEDLDATTE